MADMNNDARAAHRARIASGLLRVQEHLRFLTSGAAGAECPFLRGLADAERRTSWHACSVGDRLSGYLRRSQESEPHWRLLVTGPDDAANRMVVSRLFPALAPRSIRPPALRALRSSWPDVGVLSSQPAAMVSVRCLAANEAPAGEGLCEPRALTRGERCMMNLDRDQAPRTFPKVTAKQLTQDIGVILGAAAGGDQVRRIEALFGCKSKDFESDLAEVVLAAHDDGPPALAGSDAAQRMLRTAVSFIPDLFHGSPRSRALFASSYPLLDLILLVSPAGADAEQLIAVLYEQLVAAGVAVGVTADRLDLAHKVALLVVPASDPAGPSRAAAGPREAGGELAGTGMFADPASAALRIPQDAAHAAHAGVDGDLTAIRQSSPEDWRSVQRLKERIAEWVDRATDLAQASRTGIGRAGVRDLEQLQSVARAALGERRSRTVSSAEALAAAQKYAEWQTGFLEKADLHERVKALSPAESPWRRAGGANDHRLADARREAVAGLDAAVHQVLDELWVAARDGERSDGGHPRSGAE
jgi:hypothetical protein